MSTAKEIRTKIRSIKNTQKITGAMEMVAASKMRKAQDRMLVARPYADRIRHVVGHVAHGNLEYRHQYLEEREIKTVGMIIATTDRGLCGPLNTNLLRQALMAVKDWHQQGVKVQLCIIGNKGLHFFRRFGANIVAHAEHLGDAPTVSDLIGVVKTMLDAFCDKQLDHLTLFSNQFLSTMSQKPRALQLLPLVPEENAKIDYHWDYIYEPDAKELLTELLNRYIETQVYQGVIENVACEQAARMVAMKNATDNAGKIIDDLQLMYNKARQAAITQEIAEIIGGASAVE